MSRAMVARVAVFVSLLGVGGIGGTVAGQSAQTKPTHKKPVKTAPAKGEPSPKPGTTAKDIKIHTRYTSGAQVSENTTYVKGARQRVEFPGLVSIEQCDLGRTVVISPATSTYLIETRASAAAKPSDSSPKPTKGGVVTYTTTLTDTGERKKLFGLEARRVTTTLTRDASPSACDKTPVTVEVDGWYIDFPIAVTCPLAATPVQPPEQPSGACVDRVESQTKGDAKLGFPVAMTTTTRTGVGDKQEIDRSSMEVTEFEMTSLDAALFDVPAGYKEAHTGGELLAGMKVATLEDALIGSTADGTSAAAPRHDGAIRIGVLEPTDKSTHNLQTPELRQALASDFHKTPFEALTLSGTSVANAQADAVRMNCDYILSTEVTDIKTSKPGKMGHVLKKVSGDGPPRDVHEVKVEYKLYPVAASAPAITDTAKATSGGGFNLHSAVHLAMFAGSTYLRFSGLGMLMNPMFTSGLGGSFGSLAATGLFDPRMTAMSSMTRMFLNTGAGMLGAGGGETPAVVGTGGSDGPDAESVIRETVRAALANEARDTMEQLQRSRKK